MVADRATKDVPTVEGVANVDAAPSGSAVLTQKEIHPLALEGARRLISKHSDKTPVVIKSWGSPDTVYADVRQSLINFGYGVGLAEEMAEKLVDHAEDHSEAAREKYGANIIALKIEVSTEKPDTQFETGALETQRIDGLSNQGQVAGATAVAMGIDTGGTTVTAVRDAVGEILQAIAGKNPAVWISFEAPNRSELQGLANEAAIAAVAQVAGGELTPDQVESLVAELNVLSEAGLLPPEMLSALEGLNQIQAMAAEGNLDGIGQLSDSVIADLSTALETGDISPEIVAAALDIIESLPENHSLDISLDAVVDMAAMSALQQDIQVAQIVQQVEMLGADLTGADLTNLDALIEALNAAEGAELLKQLNEIEQHLENAGVDVADLSALSESISALKESVMPSLSLDQKLDVLAQDGSHDMLALIEQLAQMENPPAAIQEILDQINIEALSPEIVERALKAEANTELGALLQDIVGAVSTPEVLAAMPQDTLNQVNQFMDSQADLVNAVTASTVVSELTNAIADLDPGSPEATQIQNVIDHLEAGESLDAVSPSVLEQVADKLGDVAPPQITDAVTTIENAQHNDVVLGADTVEALQTLAASGELDAQTQTQVEAILDNPQTADPNIVQDVVETLGDAAPAELKEAQPIIEKAIENYVQPTPVVEAQSVELNASAVEALEALADSGTLNAEAQAAVEQILNNPEAATAQAVEALNEQLGDTAPAQLNDVIAEVAKQEAPVSVSETAVADINTAVDSVEVTAEVKADLQDALQTGDAVKAAEIIADNPALADAIPEAAVAEVTQAAAEIPKQEAVTVEASANDALSKPDPMVADNLEAMTLVSTTPEPVKEAIQEYLADPQDTKAYENVKQALGEDQPITQALAESVEAAPQTSTTPDVAISDQSIAQTQPETSSDNEMNFETDVPKCHEGGCGPECTCGFNAAAGDTGPATAVVENTSGISLSESTVDSTSPVVTVEQPAVSDVKIDIAQSANSDQP
ncbi:MAG: hypothetical protein HRT94_08910, partial [Alphaproteobacteria bacterium]|nr:hypothetical protein [Alphaproteobacteria bacterium]